MALNAPGQSQGWECSSTQVVVYRPMCTSGRHYRDRAELALQCRMQSASAYACCSDWDVTAMAQQYHNTNNVFVWSVLAQQKATCGHTGRGRQWQQQQQHQWWGDGDCSILNEVVHSSPPPSPRFVPSDADYWGRREYFDLSADQ